MLVKHAIIRTCALTPDQRNAVDALIDRSTQADGVSPLNEAASFGLQGRGHVMHWLAYEQGALVGYAQADRDTHSVQLVVSPKIRRQGVGTALAKAVQQVEKEPNWWAFDNGDGARALADRIGATLDRELLIMERDLVEHPVGDEPTPEGVELSAFVPTDAMAVVDVNADAFAEHPEQGDMTLDDFQVRTQEPWFDTEGLIVARDDDTGAMLGFHWTKIETSDPAFPDEPIGEVYVIGVAPEASGRGIGRALLNAGLAHLAARGVRRVRLYVEASSTRAVRMYESASFVLVTKDASYTS